MKTITQKKNDAHLARTKMHFYDHDDAHGYKRGAFTRNELCNAFDDTYTAKRGLIARCYRRYNMLRKEAR